MIQTKSLKILILITHALIIVGMGHGIACFGILEIFGIYSLFETAFNSNAVNDLITTSTSVVVLFSIIGQCLITFSLFNRIVRRKYLALILGIISFWLSVGFFIVITLSDHYTMILYITIIPLAYCTLKVFFDKPLKRIYNWIIDKEDEVN